MGDSGAKIDHVKGFSKQGLEMKDLGVLHYFLGIKVIKASKGIW